VETLLESLPEALLAADVAYTCFNSLRSVAPGGALSVRTLDGTSVVWDVTRGDAYYNRVIGLSEGSLGALSAAIALHHGAGRACHVTLTPDRATPPVLELLAERGFRLVGADAFFSWRCQDPLPEAPEVPIRRAVPADLETVALLWGQGELPPERWRAWEAVAGAQFDPRFPIALVSLEGRPAAMATMFIDGPLAWLGNANTLPAFRGRGCQRALLRWRMAEARRRGCRWAITDTQFGTASHRNALRAGMQLALMTAELQLPPI
jgi:GNAT superfamily N-acetyltransferase